MRADKASSVHLQAAIGTCHASAGALLARRASDGGRLIAGACAGQGCDRHEGCGLAICRVLEKMLLRICGRVRRASQVVDMKAVCYSAGGKDLIQCVFCALLTSSHPESMRA